MNKRELNTWVKDKFEAMRQKVSDECTAEVKAYRMEIKQLLINSITINPVPELDNIPFERTLSADAIAHDFAFNRLRMFDNKILQAMYKSRDEKREKLHKQEAAVLASMKGVKVDACVEMLTKIGFEIPATLVPQTMEVLAPLDVQFLKEMMVK